MSDASENWPHLHGRIVELAESGRTDVLDVLLFEFPNVRHNAQLLFDCIHVECEVCERLGRALDVQEYMRRFPEHADSLQALFTNRTGENHPSTVDAPAGSGPSSAETELADATTQNISPSVEVSETYVPANGGVQSVGGIIGRYEIIHEIARGAMGVVYKAFDPQLDRMVAVKLIKSGELADQEQVQRFRAEAQAAAQLHHSGIVPVYEVGEHESRHFLVMEFIEGRSLSREVANSPPEPQLAARLIQQVAEAVQYAHDCGIIHRDLKPENILLAMDGRPRVLDFGLAKRQTNDSSLTQTGQILGTPSYMSPEQAQGRTNLIGRHSDVYSLGATFYYLLTGRPPFRGANQLDTILQVVGQEPTPPRRLNASIPHDLETICLKCLHKDPDKRYASARDFADDLGNFLRGDLIQARRAGRIERIWRWIIRRRWAALVIGLVIIEAMALLIAFLRTNEAQNVEQQANTQPQAPLVEGKSRPTSDSALPPVRDMIVGGLRRELFDGRSLTGWRVVHGEFRAEDAPEIGRVLSIQGMCTCLMVNRDDEVLENYRLQLTFYPNEADTVAVQFGEVGGEDVPRSFYSLVLSSSASYLEQSAADGRETKRIAYVSPFEWNPSKPHSIVIERQHGWWFVSVDDSKPLVVPRGEREPLRSFQIQSQGPGAAWIKSVQVLDLVEPPPRKPAQ